MKMKLKTVFSLVMAIASSVFALAGCGKPEENKVETVLNAVAVETALATKQDIEETIQAQGTLAPGQGASVKISPVVAGRISLIKVKEGDRVTAGQIVAVLDSRTGRAMNQSASAALSVSEAQARQSGTAARATAIDSDNAISVAKLALETAKSEKNASDQQAKTALLAAETDLSKTRAGSRPQEVAQAEQTTLQAKATLDRAETELERQQFLYDKGIAAKRVLDDATTAQRVAKSGYETAKQQESLIKAGARTEDVRASELRLRQAREAQAQAENAGNAKIDQAKAALKQARDGKLNVQAKLQEAKAAAALVQQKEADLTTAQIANSTSEIRSPVSGTVVKRNQNPGDVADPATGILEISNLSSLNLIGNIAAEQGVAIKRGMQARITCLELPGQTFPGFVTNVGQVDPMTNLLSFRVAVSASSKLRSGLFATAEIVIRRLDKSTVVPKKALITKEGKASIFVAGSDGVAKLKTVEVGVEQGENVQILKGVDPGEKVITLGQFELADGAKIKEAGAETKGESPEKDGAATATPDEKAKDAPASAKQGEGKKR